MMFHLITMHESIRHRICTSWWRMAPLSNDVTLLAGCTGLR